MEITGSLQIKNNTYYSVIRVPDENGVLRQKWKTTGISSKGKTRREEQRNLLNANKELEKLILKYETQSLVYSNGLFVDWINDWLERKKENVRLDTWESYKLNTDSHIIPYFAHLNLKGVDVTARHIQRYIDSKYKSGLSAKSIQKHMVILRGTMLEALKFSMIPFNPCDRVTLPKLKKFSGKAYTVKQANTLISVLKNEPIFPAVMLGLFLGLRRSEVLGLRWKDVDFKEDLVHIRNTVVRSLTLIELEETKSRASKRDLILMPKLKEYLKQLKLEQTKNRLLFGQEYYVNDHVCTQINGKPFSPAYLTHKFSSLLEANGLPHIRFHDLRHTAGSILLNNGKSLEHIKEYLGHEQLSTTDIYTHLDTENKKGSADVIDKILQTEGC